MRPSNQAESRQHPHRGAIAVLGPGHFGDSPGFEQNNRSAAILDGRFGGNDHGLPGGRGLGSSLNGPRYPLIRKYGPADAAPLVTKTRIQRENFRPSGSARTDEITEADSLLPKASITITVEITDLGGDCGI